MLIKGRYYMHRKAADVCVLILQEIGSGTYEVQWWNIGQNGTPSPLKLEADRIYMHPDVWSDITEYLHEPRDKWN